MNLANIRKSHMRFASSAIVSIALVLLTGCAQNSPPAAKGASLNCTIEVQIAVRSDPYKSGDGLNDGDFLVLSSNVLPLHSTGGAGHAVCNTDGVIVEMQWDAVRQIQEGTEQRMSFDNLRWNIENPLIQPNGVTMNLRAGPDAQSLNTEFTALISPLNYSSGVANKMRVLVIRARVLPKPKPAKSLTLPQIPNAATAAAA